MGYARVSTIEQNLDLQIDALKDLRRGDTLVVWKLDRLGSSLRDLIELINDLQSKNIMFCSIQNGIDHPVQSGNSSILQVHLQS